MSKTKLRLRIGLGAFVALFLAFVGGLYVINHLPLPYYQTRLRPIGKLKNIIELHSSWYVRSDAASELAAYNDESTIPFLETRAVEDDSLFVQMACVKAIGRIESTKADDALLRLLVSSFARGECIEMLGERRCARAYEPIIVYLGKEPYTRTVVEALGKLGDVRAIPHIKKHFASSDSMLRASVVEALERIGTKDSVDLLLVALKDSDEVVRHFAVSALAEKKDIRIAPALIETSREKDADVRAQAAWALRYFSDRDVASRLVELLSDPDEQVYIQALYSLKELSGRDWYSKTQWEAWLATYHGKDGE